jgi:LPXTG-site transpeptidase (sortase) family protein
VNSGNLLEGNIVLYAHNRKDLFGPIVKLEKGRLIILNSNNLQQKYEVIEAFEASPTDIHLIQNQDENLLTMYTCSGWFDSKRFFVIAKPIE